MSKSVKETRAGVKALPLDEQIATRLREDVLSGRLRAGRRLGQQELAVRFGVSRIPVRDALRILEAEGLVTNRSRSGAVVAALSVEDLDELYDMRIALEPANARAAVQSLTAEDDDAMARHLHTMRVIADDVRAWLEAHAAFHRTLNERSGRARTNALLETLRGQTERYVRLWMVEANAGGLLREHERICEAAQRRDAEGVEVAVREHLELVRDKVVAHLRAHGATRS